MINLKIGETELLVGRPTFRMLFGSGCRTPPNEGLCRGGGTTQGIFRLLYTKKYLLRGFKFLFAYFKITTYRLQDHLEQHFQT